jgi:hypothetical protein
MTRSLFRTASVLGIFVLALCLTGCASNNKGKIEGKWALDEMKGMYLEFKSDGNLVMGASGGFGGEGGADITFPLGTYKLGSGDNVHVTPSDQIKNAAGKQVKAGKAIIKINGDKMTWTDAEGTRNLTKMK